MKEFKMKPGLGLFISLAFIFALSVTTSVAQQKTRVAGTVTAADTKTETINVGDTEDDHILSLSGSEGTNVSTGKHKFMDGSDCSYMGQADLVKGNGTQQGYGKMSQNADSVFLEWEGHIITLSSNGRPMTTFEGTWSWTKGTGQFENIQGSGTYKGKYISRTIWTAEWEGDYFIAPVTTKK